MLQTLVSNLIYFIINEDPQHLGSRNFVIPWRVALAPRSSLQRQLLSHQEAAKKVEEKLKNDHPSPTSTKDRRRGGGSDIPPREEKGGLLSWLPPLFPPPPPLPAFLSSRRILTRTSTRSIVFPAALAAAAFKLLAFSRAPISCTHMLTHNTHTRT